MDEDTVEPVNLPTVPLPISNLPRFDIALPQYTKPADRSTDKENSFKFASPIKVTSTTIALTSISDFTFSSPLNATTKTDHPNDLNSSSKTLSIESNDSFLGSSSAPNFMWSGSTAPRPKEKASVQESAVPKIASSLKTGSVVDFLKELKSQTQEKEKSQDSKMESEKVDESTNEIEILNKVEKSESWECSECLIRNENTTHCTACKSSKPGTKVKEPPRVSTANTPQLKPIENDCFGSQFKLSSDQWECTSCLVRNKQTADKCVSCSTPKPGAKPANSGVESDLLKKFKPAGDSWECPGCMVRNNGTVATCPCCTTAKPGKKDSKNDVKTGNSLQVSKSFDGFKPSKSTWECPCCMVRNADTVTVCPCCKAVKPGSTISSSKKPEEVPKAPVVGFGDKFKTPAGSWSCDACLVSNKVEATECVACTSPKPGTQKSLSSSGSTLQFSFGAPPKDSGFKFGIDADAKPSSESTGFTFGVKTTTTATTSTEKFSFGIPQTDKTSETPKATGFTFGQKADEGKSSVEKQENKPTFSFGIPKTEEKKPETVTSESTEKKVDSFSFGVPKSKETGNDSGFKFSATKRPADDEGQVKKPIFGESSGIQSLSSPFSPTVTSSQATTSSSTPSFSFTSPNSASTTTASAAATATTVTTATSLPPFSNTTFSFSDQSKSTQPTTISFGAPSTTINTFSFGGKTETTTPAEKKPLLSFPSATPNFGSPSATPFGKSETLSAFGNVEKKPLFGAQEKVPGFGEKETKTPSFGTPDKSISAFGTSSPAAPLFPSATPSFGGGSTTSSPFGSTAPIFGNSATPGFGSPATTTTTTGVFAAKKPNETESTTTPSSNLFTFGSSQPASGGFSFSGGNTAAPATTSKAPVFAFGVNANTTQAGSSFGGSTFSTSTTGAPAQSGFSFNSPKPEAPSAFGQSIPTGGFGAAQPPQPSFSGAGTSNTGFNFGSTAPAAPSGGYNFGVMVSLS